MSVWTTWNPDYLLEGWLKGAMALVSVATAVVLWPLLPRAIALPGTEDLRRSNEALTRFAYVAAHDLREPLRSVSAYSELVQQEYADRLDDQGRQWLSFVQRDALRTQELVEELLSLARLQQRPLHAEPIRFGELCDKVMDDLRALREEKRADVVVSGAQETLVADRAMIHQALQNLVANALKYAEHPEVVVALECDHDAWRISVADNGPGIAEQHQSRIFEPFQRLASDPHGTGIGLAIVRQAVSRHGGSARVESAPGTGSTFVLTLPRREQRT